MQIKPQIYRYIASPLDTWDDYNDIFDAPEIFTEFIKKNPRCNITYSELMSELKYLLTYALTNTEFDALRDYNQYFQFSHEENYVGNDCIFTFDIMVALKHDCNGTCYGYSKKNYTKFGIESYRDELMDVFLKHHPFKEIEIELKYLPHDNDCEWALITECDIENSNYRLQLNDRLYDISLAEFLLKNEYSKTNET